MPSFSKVILASLAASSALALPTPHNAASQNAVSFKKRGFSSKLSYRAPKRNVKRQDTGSATPHYDGGWVMPVSIGGQVVALNLDTGSSDLWVASTALSSAEQVGIQQTKNYIESFG